LISTHSTLFVDRALLSHITQVSLNLGYTSQSQCTSVDDVFGSLGIRNSDFLFYDRFLVIEGATEQHLIPGLYKKYTGNSLQDDNIQLIQLGGTGNWDISRKLLESALRDFGKAEEQIVWLFDNDFHSKIHHQYKTSNVFFVGTQDIEDSISSEVWEKVIGESVSTMVESVEDVQLAERLVDRPFTMSSGDIEAFKKTIVDKPKAKTEDKFAYRISKLVRQKLTEIKGEQITYPVLPSKGEASATLLLKHISDLSQVDPNIKNAFDRLRVVDVVPELKATADTLATEAGT
jgi:predicted ATP-dependent endonuclease of OLD family